MAFGQITQWVVITGAPSSGKTSVIEALQKRGYATQEESARAVIEEKLQSGQTLDEVRAPASAGRLQGEILERKLALEKKLDPHTIAFLDRGIPDSISYFRLAGIDTAPAIAASKLYKYRQVFIFDRLPLQKDGVRSESENIASLLDAAIENDYKAMGYNPVRVPVMPIEERADFILAHLGSCAAA